MIKGIIVRIRRFSGASLLRTRLSAGDADLCARNGDPVQQQTATYHFRDEAYNRSNRYSQMCFVIADSGQADAMGSRKRPVQGVPEEQRLDCTCLYLSRLCDLGIFRSIAQKNGNVANRLAGGMHVCGAPIVWRINSVELRPVQLT